MLNLIETHCIPILTYAIEVIVVSDRDIRRQLTVAYNFQLPHRSIWHSITILQTYISHLLSFVVICPVLCSPLHIHVNETDIIKTLEIPSRGQKVATSRVSVCRSVHASCLSFPGLCGACGHFFLLDFPIPKTKYGFGIIGPLPTRARHLTPTFVASYLYSNVFFYKGKF